MADDRRQEAALNQFWNNLVRGEPETAGDLDPAVMETVRRLRGMAQTPPPASARARVRQALRAPLQAAELNERMQPMNQTLPAEITFPEMGCNGRSARPAAPPPPMRSSARRGRWFWTPLSLAAAIVLVLGGLWRFSDPGEPGQGGSLPAALASPIAAAATPDPQTAIGTLVDALLPGGEAGPRQYVVIERLSFPSDKSAAASDLLISNSVIFVLTGQVTVTVSVPAQLHKGLGAATATTVAARVPVALEAGDALAFGPGVLEIVHQGNVPAKVLELGTIDQRAGPWHKTNVPDLVLASGVASFSAAPLHLVLRRMVLAPQQTIPAPAAGASQLAASEGVLGTLKANADGSITNLYAKPLPVLVQTITQAGAAAATPTA